MKSVCTWKIDSRWRPRNGFVKIVGGTRNDWGRQVDKVMENDEKDFKIYAGLKISA